MDFSDHLLAAATFACHTFADTTSNAALLNCNVVRQAHAVVLVYKTSFIQKDGIWTPQSQEVGRANTNVPVIDSALEGCRFNSLRIDNVVVNGNPETINVNAWM